MGARSDRVTGSDVVRTSWRHNDELTNLDKEWDQKRERQRRLEGEEFDEEAFRSEWRSARAELKAVHDEEMREVRIAAGERTAPVALRPSEVPAIPELDKEIFALVALNNDLSPLNPEQKVTYYGHFARSLGLNPFTKPFEIIKFNDGTGDKEVLYPTAVGANQLAQIHGVSTRIAKREVIEGVFIVTAVARDLAGREEERTGAVPLMREEGEYQDVMKDGKKVEAGKWPDGKPKYKRKFVGTGVFVNLSPLDRANAMKKAETQAIRRAKLGLIGFGSTVDTVEDAVRRGGEIIDASFTIDERFVEFGDQQVDMETGEIYPDEATDDGVDVAGTDVSASDDDQRATKDLLDELLSYGVDLKLSTDQVREELGKPGAECTKGEVRKLIKTYRQRIDQLIEQSKSQSKPDEQEALPL